MPVERTGGRLIGTREIGALWGNILLRNSF